MHNKEGKIYKKFSTKEKALRYTKYLGHKQLATVEYFKKARHDGVIPLYAEFDGVWRAALKGSEKIIERNTGGSWLAAFPSRLNMPRPHHNLHPTESSVRSDLQAAFQDAFLEREGLPNTDKVEKT